MTHQEGNKLIAEFMEWTEFPGNMIKEKLGVAPVRIDGLKFHSSWDALMPVVEKIENMEVDSVFYEVLIGDLFCSIKLKNQQNHFYVETNSFQCKSKIDAVWQTVIKFIKLAKNV